MKILRVSHDLRGVMAPAGEQKLELVYEPAAFTRGVRLAGVGVLGVFSSALLKRREATPASCVQERIAVA